MFVLGNPRHDIGNCKVEIVSLLSHRKGEVMVCSNCRKLEWGLGKITRKFCLAFFPISRITSLRKEILGFQ
jgi:hypothetical protein